MSGDPQTTEQLQRELRATGKFAPVNPIALDDLRRKQKEGTEALRTFLPSWNRACRDEGGGRGLAFGWYVLMSGLTGAGKTLLALNLIAEALRQGEHVLLFSLEMSWSQVVTRLRSIVTGEDVTTLEWGGRFDPDRARAADQELLDLPGTLYLNREPIWELEDVGAVMDVYRRKHDVRLFVVDYVQLVSPSGRDSALFEAMSEVSSTLRYQARNVGAVTVALSQLNRASTRERKVSPTVDGLFGSSRFGFDADQVLALDFSRTEDEEVARQEKTWLTMLKNRHGPAVDVPVLLDKRNLRFREAAEGEEELWP